jgi:lipoprotein-anchoring transpeptidase ErfK/SrfK
MFLKFSSTGFAILPHMTQSLSTILFASSWLVLSLLIGQSTLAQTSEAAIDDSSSDASLNAAAANPSSVDNSEWVEASVSDLKQSSQQWIQIDLSDQRLTAWEGNTPVFSIMVSTGRASDATPTGVYAIETKYRMARMQGESQGKQYDIPDVPYTMYFSGSYAIHGAYWHSSFGDPVSSGCINVPVEGAAWLFDWANAGTPVVVQN